MASDKLLPIEEERDADLRWRIYLLIAYHSPRLSTKSNRHLPDVALLTTNTHRSVNMTGSVWHW